MKVDFKLEKQEKQVYDYLAEKYKLKDDQLMLARMIATSWSHMLKAEAEIERDGVTIDGRYGKRSHPGNTVIKDCKGQILAALKQLNLEKNEPMDDVLKDFM